MSAVEVHEVVPEPVRAAHVTGNVPSVLPVERVEFTAGDVTVSVLIILGSMLLAVAGLAIGWVWLFVVGAVLSLGLFSVFMLIVTQPGGGSGE